MRWFKLNNRTYNLGQLKAFEVHDFKDGRAILVAVHSFAPERKTENLGTFESVKAAEEWIAKILKDDLTVPDDLPVPLSSEPSRTQSGPVIPIPMS